MKVALINGSPKFKNSSSGVLLENLKRCLGTNAEISEYCFRTSAISNEVIEELKTVDAWVIAYPLYVDGVPGHLLSCLVQLEEAHLQKPEIHVYGIANCGFYEGVQAEFSLHILRNWCAKMGIVWGGGLGIGAAGGLAVLQNLKPGFGPKAPIEKALNLLADTILKKETIEDKYLSLAIPRFVYKACVHAIWRRGIKANGGKISDLGKIPE